MPPSRKLALVPKSALREGDESRGTRDSERHSAQIGRVPTPLPTPTIGAHFAHGCCPGHLGGSGPQIEDRRLAKAEPQDVRGRRSARLFTGR